jgi:hypothetical protein
LCNYNGANSETIFNTFAAAGGSEAIFDSCIAAYGTLPSSEWDFNTTRRGQAFYGHTGGGAAVFRLVVINNGRSEAGPRSTGMAAHFASTPAFTNLEDCRGFIVGESHPGGPGTASLPIAGGSYVRMNGSYLNMIALAPEAGQQPWTNSSMAGFPQVGWAINNILDIDASARQYQFAMYNGPEGSSSTLKLIGNFIRVRTGPTTEFRIDYWEPNRSSSAAAYNNIFVKTGPGTARFNIGSGDGISIPSAIGNAFYEFSLTGIYSRYVTGARNIVLATEPAFGMAPSCGSPLLFNADPLPMGIKPSVDHVGTEGVRCTIGPIEASPCADVDGDGRFTAEDLYLWHRTPSDINGDGQINTADAELIERAIRWAESFAIGLAQNRVKP